MTTALLALSLAAGCSQPERPRLDGTPITRVTDANNQVSTEASQGSGAKVGNEGEASPLKAVAPSTSPTTNRGQPWPFAGSGSTTTTGGPSPVATGAPVAVPPTTIAHADDLGPPPGSSAGRLEPCGGDLPPCKVKQRESGGNYQAQNPRGCSGRGCWGAWQFDPRTWDGVARRMGRSDLVGVRPDLASPADQDAVARAAWANGAGCAHWAACG